MPDFIGCGTVKSWETVGLGVIGGLSAISSIWLLLAMVMRPTSICGGGGIGAGVGSLSVVVFHAVSSPDSANTNLFEGLRLSIFSEFSSCECFTIKSRSSTRRKLRENKVPISFSEFAVQRAKKVLRISRVENVNTQGREHLRAIRIQHFWHWDG